MSKQNLTLHELVDELELQNQIKRDFVVPTSSISFLGGKIFIADATQVREYIPNEIFHQQMAANLGIPANYYKRMQTEAPRILEQNVNGWLQHNKVQNQLIRTFEHPSTGNIARGLLSDRYGAIDNYDILFAVLQSIKESGVKAEVKEASITDKRLYVHINAPNVEVQSDAALMGYLRNRQHEVGTGINAGIVISNSEVGFGSYVVRPRVFVKVCSNGLIIPDDTFRKVHLGSRLEEGLINWSDKTREKAKELIISQTGDAVKQFLNEGYLDNVVKKLERARAVTLDKPLDTIQNVIKEVAKSVTINEESKKNILNYFVNDGDTSALGVSQAITREAQNVDADTRYDLETVAFEMLPKIKSFDVDFVSGKN